MTEPDLHEAFKKVANEVVGPSKKYHRLLRIEDGLVVMPLSWPERPVPLDDIAEVRRFVWPERLASLLWGCWDGLRITTRKPVQHYVPYVSRKRMREFCADICAIREGVRSLLGLEELAEPRVSYAAPPGLRELWHSAIRKMYQIPRVWLAIGAVGLISLGMMAYAFECGPWENATLELYAGDEECRRVSMGAGCLGLEGGMDPTYSVVSVDSPSFLNYRTQGVFSSVPAVYLHADICVRASPSAPSGTYKVKAVYSLSCGGTEREEVRLKVRVLQSP